MRFLDLTGGDIVLLTQGKMPTEKHRSAAQKLLVKEFSIFEKFPKPLLSQMKLFRLIFPPPPPLPKQNQFKYIMSALTTGFYL